jgi:ribonucleotide monophosphatase NagD (HAD superfamily)
MSKNSVRLNKLNITTTSFLFIIIFQTNFACFFDVDGVITKGPNVIPAAKLALQELVELNIPYVFVSNTCMLESEKAEQLSNMLGVPVSYYYYITRLFQEEKSHEM